MNIHPAIIELQSRNLIKQSTDISILSKLLDEGSSVYCGFDPTADSLHIGSLLPLNVMKILIKHGVKVIALVGGATGMIGDPSFKSNERTLLSEEEVQNNINGIVKSIKSVIGEVEFANNRNWTGQMTVLNFLRTYGKCFSINNMISKEAVRSRIERDDQGISFTEFAYPILQGMDFEVLYDMRNCKIQIGGSDQWGNMVAGIDVIHKLHGNDCDVGVLTLPLLTKSDGTKFGKSESGTVWLDPKKTSPYDFFQFWMNITDEEALKLIPMFTELDISENIRELKIKFANTMTKLVHGDDIDIAELVKKLFNSESLTCNELHHMSKCGLETVEDGGTGIIDLLILANLASSKKMAREFIANGAIKINKTKVRELSEDEMKNIFNKNLYILLQKGKNKSIIVKKNFEKSN